MNIKKSPSTPLLRLLLSPRPFEFSKTMRRKVSSAFLFLFLSVFVFASFFLHFSTRGPTYTSTEIRFPSANLVAISKIPERSSSSYSSFAIKEDVNYLTRRVASIQDSSGVKSVSVLLPDWEVLLIVLPESTSLLTTSLSGNGFLCLYPNNETSPARFSAEKGPLVLSRPSEPMLRWTSLAYESFSTENDVVVFAKGLNHRQGVSLPPKELACVFIDETSNNTVRTAVTTSIQEVFRCQHPDLTSFGYGREGNGLNKRIKLSLEIHQQGKSSFTMPSVAYYTPWRKLETQRPKPLLCASTMVFDVAKVLREWVMYHSKIGVEKFVIYDNDSDDDLMRVIKELTQEGYNIETVFWIWPKTQEAGFSHATLYAKDSCTWMMYLDVDEFVFAPSWVNSLQPPADDPMLKSLLPKNSSAVVESSADWRKEDNRHKSIVLLDAVDRSLLNAIHHFKLKETYRTKPVSLQVAVVNHYKYQAWSEFKVKFRRRVSAYVVDWTRGLNPSSKDRAPGLGFEAVEPAGWERKFCEVRDDRLKLLTRRWFGKQTLAGSGMAWRI
ncbi:GLYCOSYLTRANSFERASE FAMILY 92 PROTEIN [Salix purpurea]|uniref:Glycosyltransferase family 92 protein n=1 Tax=Salix purpurea TaxID=77065 RepID=A0A9Q0WUF7_SALPP|nr:GLYCOSYLTRANSFERASE FAMILY 92 PROTEIN [Salix purpurea]